MQNGKNSSRPLTPEKAFSVEFTKMTAADSIKFTLRRASRISALRTRSMLTIASAYNALVQDYERRVRGIKEMNRNKP